MEFLTKLLIAFIILFYTVNVKSDDGIFENEHRAFLGSKKKEFDDLSLEESRRRLRILLPYIDDNKDGSISFKELEVWVRIKYESLHEDEDLTATFRETDQNFDNKVSWEEYIGRKYGIVESATDELSNSRKEHFRSLLQRDTNRWKYADVSKQSLLDFKQFLFFSRPKQYKEMLKLVAEEELEHADLDDDGSLSLEEFLDSIHLPEMRDYDTNQFHKVYDINKDGKLDIVEVEIWKTPELYDKSELEAKHLFDIADDDKDNLLSADEIDKHYFVFVGSKMTQSGQMLHDEF